MPVCLGLGWNLTPADMPWEPQKKKLFSIKMSIFPDAGGVDF